MNVHEAVRKRIETLLLEKGWGLSELSRRSGVNQSTLSEIMSGRSKHPRVITLKKIAFAFDLTLSDFFDYESFNFTK